MDVDSWLNDYVHRLLEHEIATEAQLVGCEPSEVAAVENEYGLSLPRLYRLVLTRFGRGAGRLVDVNEFDFYYPNMVALNKRIRSRKTPIHGLPKEPYLVVLGRYDEVFQYVLDAQGASDAAVYQLDLDDGVPREVYSSLTTLLEALLADHLP